MQRKRILTLFLFVTLVASFFYVDVAEAQGSGAFGNSVLSNVPVDVWVEDDFYVVDSGTDIIYKLRNGTTGYNEIWCNGSVLVQNELWYLEYLQANNWKVRGLAQNVTVNRISDYHVEVIRGYTDYLSTSFNMTYSFIGGKQTKISFNGYIGQEDNYRIRWSTSGINRTYFENVTNSLNFWDEGEQKICFNYNDVYLDFGNITTSEVEVNIRNHKLDLYFGVGVLPIGHFTLDPSFGWETQESSSYSTIDIISGGVGAVYKPASSGTLTTVTAYLTESREGASPQSHACALVYDYNNSYAYVGKSNEKQGFVSTGWVEFSFTTQPSITANNWYLLSVWSESQTGDLRIHYGSGGGAVNALIVDAESYDYGNPPDPFSATGQWTDNRVSIYANYTTGTEENLYASITETVSVGSTKLMGYTRYCDVAPALSVASIASKEVTKYHFVSATQVSTVDSSRTVQVSKYKTVQAQTGLSSWMDWSFNRYGAVYTVTSFDGWLETLQQLNVTGDLTALLVLDSSMEWAVVKYGDLEVVCQVTRSSSSAFSVYVSLNPVFVVVGNYSEEEAGVTNLYGVVGQILGVDTINLYVFERVGEVNETFAVATAREVSVEELASILSQMGIESVNFKELIKNIAIDETFTVDERKDVEFSLFKSVGETFTIEGVADAVSSLIKYFWGAISQLISIDTLQDWIYPESSVSGGGGRGIAFIALAVVMAVMGLVLLDRNKRKGEEI